MSTQMFIQSTAKPHLFHMHFNTNWSRTWEGYKNRKILVQFANCAALIATIFKTDGSFCICGDYKLTINKASKVEIYFPPLIADFLHCCRVVRLLKVGFISCISTAGAGGKFTAAHHNSHAKGPVQIRRLPYGITSAPTIFQKVMESLLQDMLQVCIYIDDIVVTGSSQEEHLEKLEEVVVWLKMARVRPKNKCLSLMFEVEYLRHQTNRHGLQPTKEKVCAIQKSPQLRIYWNLEHS